MKNSLLVTSNDATHPYSVCCQQEVCRVCGNPATHKAGQEFLPGEPLPGQMPHNLTAYLCCAHFVMVFGDAAPCFKTQEWTLEEILP